MLGALDVRRAGVGACLPARSFRTGYLAFSNFSPALTFFTRKAFLLTS